MQAARKFLVAAFLLAATIASSQTTSNNFYPSSTGLELGKYFQLWNLNGQDANIYRDFRLWNPLNTKNCKFVTNFSTSTIFALREDGTRCTFDGGGALTQGLTDCGVWDPTLAYPAQCVVQYQGSSWVSQLINTAIAPGTSDTYWRIFAQAGNNGVNGLNGSNGAPGAPGYSPNQLLAGGGVVWVSNYNYTVSAASYLVGGVNYHSVQTNITLAAADVTNDRCDTVVLDSSGSVAVLTGTPALPAACPVADPSTQLALTYLTVAANTTVPTNIVQTDIYHENTEWTMTKSGTPINLASTNNPHAGTLDIEGTAATTGNYFNAHNPAGVIDLATRNNLIFYIRPKAAWAATRSFTIQWYNSTTAKCTPVSFTNGSFAFNSTNLAYQQIVIPLSVFSCGGVPVTDVRFTVAGSGTTLGFYVDDIILQGGIPTTQGSNAMVWKGDWNTTAAYAVNDTVQYGNITWVAVVSNTSSTPSLVNTNWQKANFPGPPFITSSANPAATGIVRLSNLDKIEWRNAANSGDEGIYYNASDQFVIEGNGGGSEIEMAQIAGASADNASAVGNSTVYVDSTSKLVCTKSSAGTIVCPGSGSGSITGSGTNGHLTGWTGSTSIGDTNLTGDVTTSGGVATTLATKYKTRVCEVVIGDPGSASSALADDNDSPVNCANVTGADVTITAVACWANAGSPTVTPILTGGTSTSIVSGAITCGTASWAAGTISGTPTIHSFSANGATCSSTPCTLDANITTAGGTAKYIVMHFTIAQ
jgi:hypothetical protein